MIRIILTYNRETLNFLVKEKEIYYTDRMWKKWLLVLPQNKEFLMKIRMSRNAIPSYLAELFDFSKAEIAEYEKAENEESLAVIIIKDAALKGCKLISKTKVEEEKIT